MWPIYTPFGWAESQPVGFFFLDKGILNNIPTSISKDISGPYYKL